MILSKEEKDHIKIWRLLKKVSERHDENYYSLDFNSQDINKCYYLPKKRHCEFESAEKTIESLEKLLIINPIEYQLDLKEIVEKLAKLKQEKKDRNEEIKELEKGYKTIIKKLN